MKLLQRTRSKAPVGNSSRFRSMDGQVNRSIPVSYLAWANTLQPTVRGRDDGKRGIPEKECTSCLFEQKVLAGYQNNLQKILLDMQTEVYPVESALASVRPRFDQSSTVLNASGRKPEILLQDWRLTIGLAIGLGLMCFGFLAFAYSQEHSFEPERLFLATFHAGAISLSAYFAGWACRVQWPWQQRTILCLPAALLVVLSLLPPFLAEQIQSLLNTFIAVAVSLVIGIVAYFSHDPDPVLDQAATLVFRLQSRINGLDGQRLAIRRYYYLLARRLREIAHEVITDYRKANRDTRPNGNQVPEFFSTKLEIPDVDPSDFGLNNARQV